MQKSPRFWGCERGSIPGSRRAPRAGPRGALATTTKLAPGSVPARHATLSPCHQTGRDHPAARRGPRDARNTAKQPRVFPSRGVGSRAPFAWRLVSRRKLISLICPRCAWPEPVPVAAPLPCSHRGAVTTLSCPSVCPFARIRPSVRPWVRGSRRVTVRGQEGEEKELPAAAAGEDKGGSEAGGYLTPREKSQRCRRQPAAGGRAWGKNSGFGTRE